MSLMFPGGTHDRKVDDRTRVVAPPGVARCGDTTYIGTPCSCLRVRHRRPLKGQPTARRKWSNRRLARRRVVAEHAIGEMKTWGIAADRYHTPLRRHTLVPKNVAGLHNPMLP